MNKEHGLFVVGIASSAGGLEPLLDLLRTAHCHGNMSFVLVPHLNRDYKTRLPQLLKKVSSLESILITDEMTLQPCKLYILPPNYYVQIQGRQLVLEERIAGGTNQAANILFTSLARSFGPNSIGVVLSGSAAGADGAMGISAIKKAKGHTYAQSPETAQFHDMPKLAIETGDVDSILTASEIGDELSLVNWAIQ